MHSFELDLASGLIGARDRNFEGRCRRHDGHHPSTRGNQIAALLFDAGLEQLHVGTITSNIVETVDDIASSDLARIPVSGQHDTDCDLP